MDRPDGTQENPLKRARVEKEWSTEIIKDKIALRERARKSKDWDGADKIRDEIRARGVGIWDDDKLWTMTDKSDGRLGILFDPEDGLLRNEVVQALIAARQKSRAQKDWEKADKIRDLLREHKVEPPNDEGPHKVSSGYANPGMQSMPFERCLPRNFPLQGTAPPGFSGPQGSGGYTNSSPGMQPMPVALSSLSNQTTASSGFSDTEMYVLLHHREKCKLSMNMAGAAALTAILHQHGVVANDTTGTFQTSTGISGSLESFRYGWQPQPQAYAALQANYTQPQYEQQYAQPQYSNAMQYPAAGTSTGSGNCEVQAMVDKWQNTRAQRRWEEADAIRSSIRAMGVTLDDSERQWVASDGTTGPYPHAQA